MPTPEGTRETILYPDFWITTDLAAELPDASAGRHKPDTNPMPTGWRHFDNHAKNVDLDYQNPMVKIQTKDKGLLGFVPGGEEQIDVSVATHAPTFQDLLFTTGMRSAMAAAIAQIQTLTITTGNSGGSSETVNVSLDSGTGELTVFPVVIAAGTDASAAAAAIRATSFTGFTVGGTGAAVIFTATTAGPRLPGAFQGAGSVAGTMAAPSPAGRGQIDAAYQDPTYRHFFMICVEGLSPEGGLFDKDKLARALFFKVTPAEEGGGGGGRRGGGGGGGGGGRRRGGGGGGGGGRGGGQGEPGKVPWGWSGEDAWLQVALSIETLSNALAKDKLIAAGYPEAVHDPRNRHVLYFQDV